MATRGATRSRSVADHRRSNGRQVDVQEQLDEGEEDDAFSDSQPSCVASSFSSNSPFGHPTLRHKMVSVDAAYDFKRRTRVIKGRPDFLQQLDDEWREVERVRMDDHEHISRHHQKRTSLQMLRVDPSLYNLAATVDSAAFKTRLGLLRSGRARRESSEQPPQSKVAWFGLVVTESAAGAGGALCMRVPYAENLLVRDIWRCAALAMSESVQELQSRCIMTYSLPSGEGAEGTRKYQLIKQTQFFFQTHLFSYLEHNLQEVKDIPIVIEGVPGVGPEDEAQSMQINQLLGTEFSPALQAQGYGSEEYRHTKRDEFLARRTMRSYVTELVDQRHTAPMDYTLSMDIDRSEPCEGITFKIPPSGKIRVCFHRGSQEVHKAVAVRLGVNEIMSRVLPLLFVNISKIGDKPTAYMVDCESRMKHNCFQVCGEEEFLAGDTPLLDFAVIRRLIFQERPIHLALVKKPDPRDDRVAEREWPRVDPHVHDIIDDSALVRITNSSARHQELKAVSAWNCEERLGVTLEGLMMVDMNQMARKGIKPETLVCVQLSLYYGEKCIRSNQLTTPKKVGPVGTVMWNERLWMAPSIKVKDLPKETKVLIEVVEVHMRRGSISEPSDSCLFWGLLDLVDTHDNTLKEGKQVVYLWLNQSSAEGSCPIPHPSPAILPADGNPSPSAVKVSLMLDSRAVPAIFPEGVPSAFRRGAKAGSVKMSLASMTDHLSAQALPLILGNLTWASKDEVGAVHQLVAARRRRRDLPLEMAFKLLDSTHADTELRQLAVDRLAELPMYELRFYILQLVQVLKYEWRHDSPLARLLLTTALANKHFGNLFFWCVRSELGDSVYHTRYSVLLEAYLSGCGETMLTTFERQLEVYTKLNNIRSELLESEGQKEGRSGTLQQVMARAGLDRVHFRPPYNQQVCVGHMDLAAAKVLPSKKRPIWLECRNIDPAALPSQSTHKMLVKHGDDLRQDMLILHTLRLMEKIWQDDSLHLCLTPYGCAATGNEVGMIEVVLGAETLAAVSSDVMNEKALYEWLQIQQKGPGGAVDSDKMHSAILTFSKSLAGYSVATFILGLTDRHNDNIMIMKEGNILHIDYGHILGNFKKFIGVKREWCPFILTPDFVYLMGGKNGHYFTTYKNLCVRAFLSLRRRADLIINLFELMRHAHLPELSSTDDVRYMRDNLFLGKSEGEAKAAFLGEIDKCMKRNWTVLLNWWTHLKRHSPAST